jgi:hypothetical protein
MLLLWELVAQAQLLMVNHLVVQIHRLAQFLLSLLAAVALVGIPQLRH